MSPPARGSSILITSAPRSARWSEPNGPAPYCSSATIRMSSSGLTPDTPSRGRVDRRLRLRELVADLRRVALVDVEGPPERTDLLAVLVQRPRPHRDDSGVRARPGLALREHDRLRPQRVAGEHRVRQ